MAAFRAALVGRVQFLAAAMLAGAVLICAWPASTCRADEHPFPNRIKAPSLEGGVEWINTSGPIDLKQLRGKFVILDFWTYCCINCMHILPELKKLEHAHPNEIVVIGVHSAKFSTERDSQNIREAVLRYEIEHPVVNDANHKIWDKFEVNTWPTLRLIDPEGFVVDGTSGEFEFETLDKYLRSKMAYYRQHGLIDTTPLRFEREVFKVADTPLRFPGKVLADEASNRLFIADSNHNRIVVAKLDGTLIDTIGSGQIGRTNGSYDKARFDHPQGMALGGDFLYVADTENHMIRKVDLKKQTVETIAGTGKQGRDWPVPSESPTKVALSSPWALHLEKNNLYIAMAGPHQIWKMSLTRPASIGLFAGNGREDIVDGPHLPREPYGPGSASFAQPSGLASDGKQLFVADSEGSSIRAVPFDNKKPVQTVIGTAALAKDRLFTFGDRDGKGRSALLQHALDVLYHDGTLYVADTYNNKIKAIDPRSAELTTLAGSGKEGKQDAPRPEFDEPSGLAYAAGKLYVADTNNHLIRTIDLTNANAVATLEIKGLKVPQQPPTDSKPSFPGATNVAVEAVKVKPVDNKIQLHVALEVPAGYKLNPESPLAYFIESDKPGGPVERSALNKLTDVEKKAATFNIVLPVSKPSGTEKLTVSLGFYFCATGSEGVCRAASVIWEVPLTIAAEGADSVKLPFKVTK